MARKREPKAESMPSSPVAAKLLIEVTRPGTPETTENRKTVTTKERQKKSPPPKKTRSKSALAKTYEARIMLSPDERKACKEVVRELQEATGTEVTQSHVMRALLSLASRAVPSIKANFEHADLPPRAANNDLRSLAEYEDALASFLLLTIQDRLHMDRED